MAFRKFAISAVIAFMAGGAFAQSYSIATSSQGSSVNNMGVAIADAAAGQGVDLRVTPFTSTTQAIPLVGGGEVSLGLANAYELLMADTGTVTFEGRQIEGLRLVATLYPFKMTLMVRADSDIMNIDDLVGRRVPSGFGTTAVGELLMLSILGAASVDYDDAVRINVSSFGEMRDAFVEGRTDAMIAVIGSGRDIQVSDAVGGVRMLPVPPDAASVERLQSIIPVARADVVLGNDGLLAIDSDMTVLAYDYYLYASVDTPDEIVVATLEALVAERDSLVERLPAFRWFEIGRLGTRLGDLDYHPAAVRFLQDNGLEPN